MYTGGPGEPYGLDGIGPVAVWYEGTLSYIVAGGPGSTGLFTSIRHYINSDGSIPHYNDDIGGVAGIWAEKWSSLDGTSWLYFTTAKTSPFKVLETAYLAECVNDLGINRFRSDRIQFYPNPCPGVLNIEFNEYPQEPIRVVILDLNGKVVSKHLLSKPIEKQSINISELSEGLYIIQCSCRDYVVTDKLFKR